MLHIIQLGNDMTLNHISLDYPVAMPVDFDPSPLGPNPSSSDFNAFAFQDKIHFCKKGSNDDCQAWNFKTGQWTVDNGRMIDSTNYYAVTEINGKLWIAGGTNSTVLFKSTCFLDEHGNWTSGPDLPQKNE